MKDNHKRNHWILIGILLLASVCGCSKAVKQREVEVHEDPFVTETSSKPLIDTVDLTFTVTQPVTSDYHVAYTCTCVVDETGKLDPDVGLAVRTSVMKKDTVLADDSNHTGIANLDNELSVNEQGQLVLQTAVSYNEEDSDIKFHYLKFITFSVEEKDGTYTIHMEEARSA